MGADGYIRAVGEAIENHPHNSTVDDVMFDMNKGFCGRMCFLGFILPDNFKTAGKPDPAYVMWQCFAAASTASELLKRARSDGDLKTRILQQGIGPVVQSTWQEATNTQSWSEAMELFMRDPKGTAPKWCEKLPLGPIVL